MVIQRLTGTSQPLDARVFEFFKGLEHQPDQNGELTTTVDNLPVGEYRLCTLTGAESHQPVVMPVARRGAQNDCIRFQIV